jgi:Pyruvate/2-oxoacid:ferredoxin oxidoreductase delta subunit
VTLVVCTDHATPVPEAFGRAYEVIGVEGLCSDPSSLIEADVANPEALMLHTGEYDLGFVQGAIRRTGVDPLGVPVITLADMPTESDLRTLGAGAIARHRAFPGAGPEHAKLHWPTLMSRRRLFALNVPQYIAAPSINPALCSAERGCRLCVESCPTVALLPENGRISYSVESCVACGICTTTCPTGATTNPSVTPQQIFAQITAMVASRTTPTGVRFRCRESNPSRISDSWFPVEVPCTGMLSIGWLLTPLLLGAASVSADTCTTSGCSRGNDERLSEHSIEAAAICEALGFEGDRIGLSGAIPLLEPISDKLLESVPSTTVADMRDTDVVLAMASLASVDDITIKTAIGAAGVIAIDDQACTLCEQCAAVCPTGALRAHRTNDAVDITFDTTVCVGCSMCVATCPEKVKNAIVLHRRFDIAELKVGRHTVRTAPTVTCEVCGGPIAPSAMLDRIGSMLGPDHAGTLDLIGRRCIDCRG